MPDNVHHGTPLTNIDTAWLHMEDPTNLMMVTGIFIFEKPLNFARLRDTLQVRMADRFPRLRHKVKQEGSSAWWVADPNFDINAHLHKIALPAPCDLGALRDVVSDLMSTPLDFSKPLWNCHYIEGCGEGSAVLLRFHHCIGDGVALVHVLLSSTDTAADAPWPKRTALRPYEKDVKSRIVSLFDGARKMVRRTVRTTRRVTGTLLQESVESLLRPAHLMELTQTVAEGTGLAAEGAGIVLKLLLKGNDPVTIYKGKLGVAKRAAWSRPILVSDVKAVGKAVGGTVNDVLLTAVSGALRRYLLLRGDRARGVEINAMVPVNLRPLSEADQLGNRFGLIYLTLPVGEGDPAERLRLVKKRMDEIKKSTQPFVTFQILHVLGLAPTEIADFAVKMFGAKATAVMTNVVGPKQPIYFAGEKIATTMFWVPQSGRMGLGVSIFSYDGRVVVGIATDRGLVPDPESIARAFEEEFEALVEWSGRSTAPLALPGAVPPEGTEEPPAPPRPARKAPRPRTKVRPTPARKPKAAPPRRAKPARRKRPE